MESWCPFHTVTFSYSRYPSLTIKRYIHWAELYTTHNSLFQTRSSHLNNKKAKIGNWHQNNKFQTSTDLMIGKEKISGLKHFLLGGWKAITGIKAIVLHAADLGSIYSITYGPIALLSMAKRERKIIKFKKKALSFLFCLWGSWPFLCWSINTGL